MKGKMHSLWKKPSSHTHSVASSYKTDRKVREVIGPPRPAALAAKVPVVFEEGRIVHPRVWTVVQTAPRQEMVAAAQLRQFGHGVYCPVITKWTRTGNLKQIRHVPLFPRYIFVSISKDADKALTACAWGKPISISTNGDMPLFDGREIYVISDLQAAGAYDEAKSEAERLAELDRLRAARLMVKAGDAVMIDDTAWGEIGATVVGLSGSDRVILLMNMLGRATKFNVSLDQIRPAA